MQQPPGAGGGRASLGICSLLTSSPLSCWCSGGASSLQLYKELSVDPTSVLSQRQKTLWGLSGEAPHLPASKLNICLAMAELLSQPAK